MRRIILPQALLAAIPPGTNLLIELLKNTSLVSLITLSDLAFRARQLDQATLMTMEIFGLALVIYFVLAQAINFGMRQLERRLARGRDRKSVVSGKSVSVRVDFGGRRTRKNKKAV